MISIQSIQCVLSVAENIAVVDDGGHLLTFVRMDGARPASVDTAITKAVSAATMRRERIPAAPAPPRVAVPPRIQEGTADAG